MYVKQFVHMNIVTKLTIFEDGIRFLLSFFQAAIVDTTGIFSYLFYFIHTKL